MPAMVAGGSNRQSRRSVSQAAFVLIKAHPDHLLNVLKVKTRPPKSSEIQWEWKERAKACRDGESILTKGSNTCLTETHESTDSGRSTGAPIKCQLLFIAPLYFQLSRDQRSQIFPMVKRKYTAHTSSHHESYRRQRMRDGAPKHQTQEAAISSYLCGQPTMLQQSSASLELF